MLHADTTVSKSRQMDEAQARTFESITLSRELEEDPANQFQIELADNISEIDTPFVVEMMDSHLDSNRQKTKERRQNANRDADQQGGGWLSKIKNDAARDNNVDVDVFECMMDEVYQPSVNSSN